MGKSSNSKYHLLANCTTKEVWYTCGRMVGSVLRCRIASKDIGTIEFHIKYMKLFVNMLFIICACVLLNTKFRNTSENIYLEVIWSRTIASFVQSHNHDQLFTWTLFLTFMKNLIFKDLYVLTPTGSTIINQKLN